MNPAVSATVLLAAALAQVTVAPLFTLSAAEPDFVLLALVMLAGFTGPRTVMWGLPLVAVSLAFLTNRDPAFLLIAYLPLLPLALFAEESALPLAGSLRLVLVGLVAGLWARGTLSGEAVLDGADLAAGTMVGRLLIPGLLLDFALLGVAAVCGRLIGWEPRTMQLTISGYQPR